MYDAKLITALLLLDGLVLLGACIFMTISMKKVRNGDITVRQFALRYTAGLLVSVSANLIVLDTLEKLI